MAYDTKDSGKIRRNELSYLPLGVKAVLGWRLPSTEEIREYKNEYMRSQFAKGADEAKAFDFGAGIKLLVEIQDGDWSDNGKPISSNPESPDYRADWKDVVGKIDIARIMIAGLADAVFGGLFDRGEVSPEPVPFPKNSEGSPSPVTKDAGKSA